ncbi:hypothetical protein B9X64_11575 [Acinetobacter pittii]|uniref:hypothetical protein n=1 Tax=Acinetobacter pittii TaxID=48296 RepID=UPI000A33A060|nr:hypothetical protein [Acinetobacter pittii]OTL74166.1 hypothetical protein B9X64_11575 [Acinetobacter pittii]
MCVKNILDGVTNILGMDAPKAQVIAPPKQPTRQDSKSPDSSATIDRVQQAQNSMSGGIANTLYTDAQGVSDEDLRLGKKNLLGG